MGSNLGPGYFALQLKGCLLEACTLLAAVRLSGDPN